MAPEMLDSMDGDELRALAQRVRDWQLAKGLSDNALLKKFPDLGSTKTFTRILNNDLSELDLERQLSNYRTVIAIIESIGEDEGREEDLYNDITATLQLRRVFIETSREQGPARFILIMGENGTGKTSARRVIAEKLGSRLCCIEATTVWNDKPSAMLAAILTALGQKYLPTNLNELLRVALEKLNETRRCLIIDEGHHVGPRLLNLIKTLLNQSPGEVVLEAVPTLWRRLEHAAYEEAKQLVGNRLAEKVMLELRRGDVEKLLRRRVQGIEDGAVDQAVRLLMEHGPKHGNLALVRETCARLSREHRDGPVNIEAFSQAFTAEVKSR